jgi:cellulose synthase/poly-beta-1,6-N-acetylglucosamine synthase-like glycosyltransferase
MSDSEISSTSPRASVVIPSFGRPDLLRKAVESLFAQDLPAREYEIIVVDSSLDEANAVMLASMQQDARCSLRCLRKKPEGPGPSRTLGFRSAVAPIIAFMDSDCEASPSWLRHGLSAFEEGVGVVQGRTLPDPNGRLSIFSLYLVIDKEDAFYQTANIFYRREALDQAGGFAAYLTPLSDKPTGGEDTETAWTVIRLGWKTRFSAEALVYHAVVQVPWWQWFVIKRLISFPRMTRRFPEFRRYLYRSYFYDKAQALFLLLLCGLTGALLGSPYALVLALPYAVFRASEPTRSLGGILRPLRIAPYFVRDCISFFIFVAGSLKYGSLVL